MRTRLTASLVLLALSAIACSGGATTPLAPGGSDLAPSKVDRASHVRAHATANVVADPGFESGGFSAGWTRCGTVTKATVTTAQAHSGTYSALLGSTAKPEVNGTEGVCQTVTVPAGGQLTFWVYEGTNDTISYADQEADLLNSSGGTITQLYKEAATTNGWEEKSFSLSAYAGESVTLYFGVKGNGWTSGDVYAYVDDVSLTGSGATASPSPTPSSNPTPSTCPTSPGCTPTPSPTPTTKPTPTPTSKPTPTPTASPTTAPTSSPYACNDPGFVTDQNNFASGKTTADQLVDVCGTVTQVLAAKKTSSGNHGYFYVTIPGSASPGTIEIVSNLDAMGEDPNPPPTTWPWVADGDYVYVQGRYYYDSSSSQGIDWTEDDTDSSWEHTGYVVVCSSAGIGCTLYE